MKDNEIAEAVAVERLALASLLETLTPEQIDLPSLCGGWTVHHVAAHLTTLWSVSMPSMVWRVVKARGSFPRAVEALTQELAKRPINELAASVRAHAGHRKHPPGMPAAPLTDVIVHGEDIRRPVGVRREVPEAALRCALEFITSGRDHGTFLPRRRLQGLRLVATDMDWAWGSGDEVRGPALSLLLAAMGRRVALADLTGATPVLDARL